MVASTRSATSKSRKRFKQQNVYKGEDRISSLPDTVLQHILSFLPTKYAVGTSILSTRWKYLWTSIPGLAFNDLHSASRKNIYQADKTSFMNFVDRVLTLHDVPNIPQFMLACNSRCDKSRINEWISTVIGRNVRDLELFINVEPPFELPCCLFTCKSLTKLSLTMRYVLKPPTTTCFSRLKILLLYSITFADDYSTQQLFSSCPVLEELLIEGCEWVNLEILKISAPALKSLTITQALFDEENDGVHDCVLKVYASNLVSFKFIGVVAKGYSLVNLSSLVDVVIDAGNLHGSIRNGGNSVCDFLKGVSNAKILAISSDTMKVLSSAVRLPTLHKVKELVLESSFNEVSIDMVPDLLQNLPNLERLVFEQDPEFSENYSIRQRWDLKRVPRCLLLHLKAVEILEFYGDKEQLQLIEYFLKNGRLLEKMTIESAKQFLPDLKKQMKVAKELLMLPRRSMSCQISFI